MANRLPAMLATFVAGGVFAAGLAIGGMTQPSKVVDFLTLTSDWDPSLAFVMGGAVLVNAVAYLVYPRMAVPLVEGRFRVPTRRDIDGRLVTGAALFGVGWGLGGFCPGPALTAVGTAAPTVLVFVASMIIGMNIVNAWNAVRARQVATGEAPPNLPAPDHDPLGLSSSK